MKRAALRVYRFFRNLKMKRKVIVTYLLLSILPIACLNLFTYHYTKNILLDRERDLVMDSLNQAVLQIDYQLELYGSLSNYLFNNAKLLAIVNDEYGDQYFKMYKAYADDLTLTFLTYYSLHPDLRQLTIYTESDLHPQGSYVLPIEQLRGQPWFSLVEEQYLPVWMVEERDGKQVLFTVRKMAYGGSYTYNNYLYMELDYDAFFTPLQAVTAGEHGLAVVDGQGQVLFVRHNLSSPPDTAVFRGDGQSLEELSGNYMILQAPLNGGLWTAYYYLPLSQAVESVTGVVRLVFFVLWMILALLGLLAWVFSTVIVSPLESLTDNMQQVRQGNLQVTVETSRTDEVGILIRTFGEMIAQIQNLIQVVYKNEIEKKEYQLAILRAQINPHFLYNALSLINSKAILAGQEEISRMALLITSFYRTALNHGREMTTVENEISNTRSYIAIQQLLTGDAFQVEYALESEVLSCPMPNFILQPIVENAVGHGLMNDIKPDKHLSVKAGRKGRHVVLTVRDNGVGMSAGKLESLLQRDTDSYGMKNVHERLHLLYGDSCALTVESSPGNGTRVTITLPAEPGDQS